MFGEMYKTFRSIPLTKKEKEKTDTFGGKKTQKKQKKENKRRALDKVTQKNL